MRRFPIAIVFTLLVCASAWAVDTLACYTGSSEQGGNRLTVNGIQSQQYAQQSYPGAIVTVYQHGTLTLANPIYANAAASQVLANPFASSTSGTAFWCAADGFYDVQYSGAGIVTPFTVSNIRLIFSSSNVLAGTTNMLAYYPTSTNVVGGKSWPDLDSLQYVAGGGTAQAQTAALSPPATALVPGLELNFLPIANNTGAAPTLAVNGLAATPITKLGAAALVANDLTSTAIASVIYDGTEFQLQNPQTFSGGFTSPMTTLGDSITGGAAGAPTRLAGPTTPNGIAQTVISVPSGGLATAQQWAVPGVAIDAQIGTTYTIPVTDNTKLVTGSNGSATAWTGFTLANNYVFACENLSTGLITYTPASGTVNAVASQIIPQNWFCLHYTDNTNTIMPVMPTIKAFPNTGTGQALAFTSATGVISAVTTSPCLSGVPTISSGFGTSPSVTAGINPCAFRINVGTGGTANSGVIGLPTAPTGWNCYATDFTTPSPAQAIKETASTASTATISNFGSGSAASWTASDILIVSCFDY